jgi:hypothetical protein
LDCAHVTAKNPATMTMAPMTLQETLKNLISPLDLCTFDFDGVLTSYTTTSMY